MLDIKSLSQSHSIVLIGTFNPPIYQPMWFSKEKLIQQQEADNADISIIRPEIVIFNLEWLRLEATQKRFIAGTQMVPYYEIIRDLVLGAFRILYHTPINRMGLNRSVHIPIDSEEKWSDIENKFAPKFIWESCLDNPSMLNLVMKQPLRNDGCEGYIRVTVESSNEFQGNKGINIQINDHFQRKELSPNIDSQEIMDILESQWTKSQQRFEEIIKKLWENIS